MIYSQTQSLFVAITLIVAASFGLNSCAHRDQPVEATNSSTSPTPAVVSMATQSPTPIDAMPATATPSPAIKMATANDDVDRRIDSSKSASPQGQKSPPSGSDPGIGNGIIVGQAGGPLDNPKVWRDPNKIDYNRIYNGKEVDRKAHILKKPEPVYTDAARQHAITGTVILSAVFTAEGQVTDIKAVSSLPDGLTERAIAAARQIKFEPAQINGRAVSMYIQLQYNFNLY